jgi:Holliday junction resolvase-like predicted endonuclease
MSETSQVQHDELINRVADNYRRKGYEVQTEPPERAIPFDLGGYRPDLIARKNDQALIVEVKASAQNVSFDHLRSVVDEVKRHPGWQFILITSQDVLTDQPQEGDEPFSWDRVAARIESTQRLTQQGEDEAAYLVLWIAFEQALRYQARQISLAVDRLAPAILIRQMYSQGELSMSQFDAALACQSVRNRLVHGFPTTDLKTAFERLASLVREVVEQWKAPTFRGINDF